MERVNEWMIVRCFSLALKKNEVVTLTKNEIPHDMKIGFF